jgi:Icc-related predicted phosphoesterase
MNDFKFIQHGNDHRRLQPEDTTLLFESTLLHLKESLKKTYTGKTVVLTHHAPSIQSVSERYIHDVLTPAFASNLEALMDKSISLWVHGHVHNSNDYIVNGTRVVSNPRGYQPEGSDFPENPEFEAYLVVEI